MRLTVNDRGGVVGPAVRTRAGVKPLFVSQGYGVTLDDSLRMVLASCGRYRVPEPTRQAHLLVSGIRRREES